MMNRKLKGFSLAELLISLLIISIVLSAAIPTLTRRAAKTREYVWAWSTQNNSAFFGMGANQSAIIGHDKIPSLFYDEATGLTPLPLSQLLYDSSNINDSLTTDEYLKNLRSISQINAADIQFNANGDKLILLKKASITGKTSNPESNFANSHISFFTVPNLDANPTATNADIKYAGRITMDQGNIAMGIGSLQNQNWDKDNNNHLGENTAIGHFALFRNSDGVRNTAIGKKSLSYNETGSYNTALGFGSLYSLGSNEISEPSGASELGFDNTAVGAYSLQYNNYGSRNTAIGAHSLQFSRYNSGLIGDDNTAIGYGSMIGLQDGNENTALGKFACANTQAGSANICIGANSGYGEGNMILKEDNFGVYIGSSPSQASSDQAYTNGSAPLISGHSRRTQAQLVESSNPSGTSTTRNFDQELVVNAKHVIFRPFNGAFDAFKFESMIGHKLGADPSAEDTFNEGYNILSGDGQGSFWGRALFNLRDTLGGTDNTSVTLRFSADGGPNTGINNKIAMIDAFDPYHTTSVNSADINFNRRLGFSFPDTSPARVHINGENVASAAGGTKERYPIILNHVIWIGNADVTPEDLESFPIPTLSLDADSTTHSESELKLGNNKFSMETDTNLAAAVIEQTDTTKNQYYIKQDASASTNEIKINQKGASNDFVIEQDGSTQKFMVKQNIGGKNPRLQLDEGVFYGQDLSKIELKASTGSFHIGSGGQENDICVGPACLKKVADGLENLKNQVQGYHSSDIRLKNVIGDNTAGLKEINALEVKNYTFKNDKEKTPHVGVIAQQLQKIFPNAVTKGEDGYLRIRTEDIFYAMVNSIKDLFKQIQDLAAKITGLDNRITELEKQNKLLQEQNKLLKKQNKAIEKRLAKLERQAAK